jgi:hypothetical protein
MLLYYTDSTVLINALRAILIFLIHIVGPQRDVTGQENLKTVNDSRPNGHDPFYYNIPDMTHFTTTLLTWPTSLQHS